MMQQQLVFLPSLPVHLPVVVIGWFVAKIMQGNPSQCKTSEHFYNKEDADGYRREPGFFYKTDPGYQPGRYDKIKYQQEIDQPVDF
jgi:hypothetical protein